MFKIGQLDSDDPSFVDNIQSVIVRASGTYAAFSDQGVDLGHVNVIELFTACLIWYLLALTATVNTSVLLSSIFVANLAVRENLVIVVKFVSLGSAPLRIFGSPSAQQCLGLPECQKMDVIWILFFGCGHLSVLPSWPPEALLWLWERQEYLNINFCLHFKLCLHERVQPSFLEGESCVLVLEENLSPFSDS